MRRPLLVLALLVTVAVPAAAQNNAQPVAELVIRLQALEDELRTLRGELEAQRFRQRELESEIERLLAAPAPAAPAVPGTSGDPALGGGGTLGGGTLGGGAFGAPAAGAPTADADAAVTRASPAAGNDEGRFADGMQLLQAGRYAEARDALDRFVAANPAASRAPEAAFWSAETLFFEGRYEAAAAAFAANYRAYGGDAPRATDSLLKVAMSLNQLGDGERACQTLDELSRRHGDGMSRSLTGAVQRERQRAGCG